MAWWLRALAASGGVLFVGFVAASFALQGTALADAGDAGDVPPEEIARMVHAHEPLVGMAGLASALAGVSLLAFTLAWRAACGGSFPAMGLVAGAWWGGLWVVSGALQHAAIDLSGFFAHPSGAKTVLAAASMLQVSPAAVVPAVVLVASVAWAAPRAGLPRWFGAYSWVTFGFAALGVLGFAAYFAGAVGLAALPLWLLVASGVLLRGVLRRRPRGGVPGPAEADLPPQA